MADLALLDRAHASIMRRMVETGQAPHYTELAADLGLSVEEGRQVLHDLIATGIPAWLHPGTDYIVSFPPFHNLPTQDRQLVPQRDDLKFCELRTHTDEGSSSTRVIAGIAASNTVRRE